MQGEKKFRLWTIREIRDMPAEEYKRIFGTPDKYEKDAAGKYVRVKKGMSAEEYIASLQQPK